MRTSRPRHRPFAAATATATLLFATGCATALEARVEALEAQLEGSSDPATAGQSSALKKLAAEADALGKRLEELAAQAETLQADFQKRIDEAVAKLGEATTALDDSHNDAEALIAKVAQIENIQELSFAVPKMLEQRAIVDKLVADLQGAHERVIKNAGQVLRARRIEVVDAEGDPVVVLDAIERESRSVGRITTSNGAGTPLIALSATKEGRGMIETHDGRGHRLAMLTSASDGRAGAFLLYDVKGTKLVSLSSKVRAGGSIEVRNDAGKVVCSVEPDEEGEGVVGAWNNEGKGRMLTPGR